MKREIALLIMTILVTITATAFASPAVGAPTVAMMTAIYVIKKLKGSQENIIERKFTDPIISVGTYMTACIWLNGEISKILNGELQKAQDILVILPAIAIELVMTIYLITTLAKTTEEILEEMRKQRKPGITYYTGSITGAAILPAPTAAILASLVNSMGGSTEEIINITIMLYLFFGAFPAIICISTWITEMLAQKRDPIQDRDTKRRDIQMDEQHTYHIHLASSRIHSLQTVTVKADSIEGGDAIGAERPTLKITLKLKGETVGIFSAKEVIGWSRELA